MQTTTSRRRHRRARRGCAAPGTPAPTRARRTSSASARRRTRRPARARARRAAPCGTPRPGGRPSPSAASPSVDGVGREVGAGEQDAPRPGRRRRPGTRRPDPARCARAGTRSGSTPARRSASAVAGPTAATCTGPRARRVAQLGHEALDRVDRREDDPAVSPDAAAAAARARPRRRRVDLVGSAAARAPRRRPRSSAVGEAAARSGPTRVTTTVRPASGRPARPPASVGAERGHRPDDDDGRRAQVDAGQAGQRRAHHAAARPWSRGRSPRPACPAPGRPHRASAMAARVVMPMRIDQRPARAAPAPPSRDRPSPPASPTRPVTTVTDEARPRWVTGMPAAAGTPKADVTPGTTSQGMPACASASTSSPPRPKRNGSPPLRRTTTADARPCSTSSRAISSWRRAARPLRPRPAGPCRRRSAGPSAAPDRGPPG